MNETKFNLSIVTSTLDGGVFVSEPLMMPDESYVADSAAVSRAAAIDRARKSLQNTPPEDLQHVSVPGEVDVAPVHIIVEPPPRCPAWEEPVDLRFDVVTWTHGEDKAVAYVPALKIAVLADTTEELQVRVASHIRFALMRRKAEKSLWELATTQRIQGVVVDRTMASVPVGSPKQRLQRLARDHGLGLLPTLKEVGTELVPATMPPAFEVGLPLRRVVNALRGPRGGSVLLVGPSGVGKTAVVDQLVRDWALLGLGDRRFFRTSGARLIAGMGGFGMWQERCRTICREAAKGRVLLHVGALVELMEVGKSMYSTIGMASFLRPYLLRGDLHIIAECTPEEIPVIEREDPHLLHAFQRVDVEEPDEARGRKILKQVAALRRRGSRETITAEAVDLLDRLHRRYASYSAYPGRPIRFLTSLLEDAGDGSVGTTEVLRAFSRETGMPPVVLDETATLDLAATEAWFKGRVMGQPEAIRQVVDILAVLKSRLGRPRKPLASLLFAGPTGVGKTETAKALAEFLFGDKNRLARFDMSEYADPTGPARLIGGIPGGEGRLTSKIREQPFSVLLLDEFEKAHPATYDLLLQVLGEGRLTDVMGRVADFRNCVIIMTSNLGAESYREASLGFSPTPDVLTQAREHFTGAVRAFLRPEMFNRIDAIIAFAPLDRDTVLGIAKRELGLIGMRDGLRLRAVRIPLGDDVAAYAAQRGFDARYGARPLKRALESEVVVPLACRLNAYVDDLPLVGTATVTPAGLELQVSADVPAARRSRSEAPSGQALREAVSAVSTLRRRLQRFMRTDAVVELENEIYRLEQLQRRMALDGTFMRSSRPDPEAKLSRLPTLVALRQSLEGILSRIVDSEERVLLSLYQNGLVDADGVGREMSQIRQDLDTLLVRLHVCRFPRPDWVVLGVYGEDRPTLFELAHAYAAVGRGVEGARVTVQQVSVAHDAATRRRVLMRADIVDIDGFFRDPPEGTMGIILAIEGPMVYPLLAPEEGLHSFKFKETTHRCLVHASDSALADYAPPAGIERPRGAKGTPLRRTYNWETGHATEQGADGEYWRTYGGLPAFLSRAVHAALHSAARKLLGEESAG